MAELFLDREALVNLTADVLNGGRTLVFLVAVHGHIEMARLLLEYGAQTTMTQVNGVVQEARRIASLRGHHELATIFVVSKASSDLAAEGDRAGIFQTAIEAGGVFPSAIEPAAAMPVEVGCGVELRGLKAKPELNGRRGRVQSLDAATGRFVVVLSDDDDDAVATSSGDPQVYRLRASNLTVVVASPDSAAGVCAGAPLPPLAQWVPHLQPAAQAALFRWALAALADSAKCFAVFFAPHRFPQEGRGGGGAAEAAAPASLTGGAAPLDAALWRGYLGHDGAVDVRRLVVSFLVYPKASTRRLLHEVAAFGTAAEAAVCGGEGGGSGGAPFVAKRVALQGLVAKPELNGARGTAIGFAEGTGRYEVAVDGRQSQPLALKPANLRLWLGAVAPATAPPEVPLPRPSAVVQAAKARRAWAKETRRRAAAGTASTHRD